MWIEPCLTKLSAAFRRQCFHFRSRDVLGRGDVLEIVLLLLLVEVTLVYAFPIT